MLVAGYGLRMIGVPPTAEEIIRLFLYGVLTVVYGAFWMGLSMLFSVVFQKAAGYLFFFRLFLGDYLLRDLRRHLFVVVELHSIGRPSLRHRL